MTENAVVAWDPNSGAALPAYLTDAAGALGTNITERMNVPSLSYEGKTWTLVKDGNKTKLQAANADGDMVPIPIMRMVILNYNPERGRAFYPGVYNPAESKQPDCWSADGKLPDPSAQKKQASACNGCPQAVKGSKVQDGKEMVACSSHRMIAIAPPGMLNEDPFRLKIAVTSDWDKTVVEHGWFAFTQYTDFIKSRGITHTGLVVTKVKFDPNTAYPKLLFSLDRLLSPEETEQVKQALTNPKVAELLAEKWSAAGTAGQLTDQSDTSPGGLEAAYADGWIAHPDSAGYSYKGTEVVDNVTLAARYPAPVPALPAETPAPAAPPAAPVAAAPEPAPAALSGLAAALADGWVKHPDGDWHYKGDVVEATDKVAAMYPAQEAAPSPAPPPAPTPEPAPEPVVAHDPMAAALADGWTKHPDGDWLYKGADVVVTADVLARYPGNAATSGTPAAPAAGTAAGTGQGAAPTASPSSPAPAGAAEIPADVQSLLDKWA